MIEAATGGVGEPTAPSPAPTEFEQQEEARIALSREEFRRRVVYECRRRDGQDGYDVVWNGLVAGWVWRKPLHLGGRWCGLAFIYGAEDRRNTPVMDGGMATWRSRDAVAEAVVRRVGRAVTKAEVWPIPARTVEGFEQGSMRGMSATELMEGEGWLRR